MDVELGDGFPITAGMHGADGLQLANTQQLVRDGQGEKKEWRQENEWKRIKHKRMSKEM